MKHKEHVYGNAEEYYTEMGTKELRIQDVTLKKNYEQGKVYNIKLEFKVTLKTILDMYVPNTKWSLQIVKETKPHQHGG